jgi:hypothetical protein
MTVESAFKEMLVIFGIFFGLIWYLVSGVW